MGEVVWKGFIGSPRGFKEYAKAIGASTGTDYRKPKTGGKWTFSLNVVAQTPR
jgi:hypothetical protein